MRRQSSYISGGSISPLGTWFMNTFNVSAPDVPTHDTQTWGSTTRRPEEGEKSDIVPRYRSVEDGTGISKEWVLTHTSARGDVPIIFRENSIKDQLLNKKGDTKTTVWFAKEQVGHWGLYECWGERYLGGDPTYGCKYSPPTK